MEKTINISFLRNWQKEYITQKKRFNVLVVHRRAGKTVGAIIDIILCAVEVEGDYGYIAPTYKQAKKIAWRIIKKFCNQIKDFSFNESELTVFYKNGSTISLFGAENPDSLRGLDLRGVIFDEYSQQPSWIYSEIVFPMINANRGWVTWIGTPKGKNSFYTLFQKAQRDERFYKKILRHQDTGLLSVEQIDDAKKEMTVDEFLQEYECSWDAYMRGSVYGKELSLAYQENRVRSGIFQEGVPVETFWDLGISDAMTVLFIQIVGKEVRIIDSYKNTGYGLDHYAEVVNEKGYTYTKHWFPHDLKNRELTTGTSRYEFAKKLFKEDCEVIPATSIESGINAGRMIFKNVLIDTLNEVFLNDISLYQYEYDDKLQQFKKTPKHDWTSHFADAFRLVAVVYEIITKPKERREEEEEKNWIDLILDPEEEEEGYKTLSAY